jgi:hypothetical protein
MARSKTSWTAGKSGNPRGRPVGTGRVEEYRKLLEPHVPDLLAVLVEKASGGDLAALRLVLDRVYPVRDATMAELLEEIEELRQLVEARRTAA